MFVSLAVPGCHTPQVKKPSLIVFAAASLQDVVQELGEQFEHRTRFRPVVTQGVSAIGPGR